ncbi:SRPBCC domain-containing protein [Paenibacillus sp. IB182496]|uniref:SRPBCC domain-containing protein n=1 Tax=Paenibacillus sabuli TaxID=2772509 RepID=A0A927GSL2_9BACL|nr:SRPBCC domain-containing protein [Paenibacillus sabuli]MBD2846869.1 SRPBCC domain-containing protein [Paenibacillus sabuli]
MHRLTKIDKVWAAVATSDGLAAWFMPNDFEPVEGHAFHLGSVPFGSSPCKVTVVDPPHRLSFRWAQSWTLTFELEAQGDTTLFTLTHSGWEAAGQTEFGEANSVVRERMNGGWTGLVEKLRGTVEAG